MFQRAIETVTRATELDLEGMYSEAVTQYEAALRDFDCVVTQGTSSSARVTSHVAPSGPVWGGRLTTAVRASAPRAAYGLAAGQPAAQHRCPI